MKAALLALVKCKSNVSRRLKTGLPSRAASGQNVILIIDWSVNNCHVLVLETIAHKIRLHLRSKFLSNSFSCEEFYCR